MPLEPRATAAPWVLVLLIAFVGILPSCGEEPLGPDPVVEITDPDTLTYAPELGVDLEAMTKTASGLYVQDLRVGQGFSARPGDTLVVEYINWLHDGAPIDASSNPNRGPFRIVLGVTNTLPGLAEGLAGIAVGGQRLLVIPPHLAYGANSLPPLIPGGATLVFWIELIQLRPANVVLQNPTEITYAPELGVDLSTMELRTSGLYVKDLVDGAGDAATAADSVVIEFSGWLNDGTLFDTSRQEGRTPLGFRPENGGGLIDGWIEGVVGMRVGGKRQLVVPPLLAFGRESPIPLIPPGSVLIFEMELVELHP